MFGSFSNPAGAYQQVGLETAVQEADPYRLILMLFEGASTACSVAHIAMKAGNIPEKGAAISKAINIIDNGLRASLDPEQGGPLAEQLGALYNYICQRLLWSNLKNDLSALEEAQRLLEEIHSAWRQINPHAPANDAAAR